MKRAHRPEMIVAATIAWFGLAITPAMGATVMTTGTNATAIDNLVIAGNTYNVTFGTTIDTTFSSSSQATSAADAIVAALDSDPTAVTVGFSDFTFMVCQAADAPGCDGKLSANPGGTAGGWVWSPGEFLPESRWTWTWPPRNSR